jgi:hypothetical protein
MIDFSFLVVTSDNNIEIQKVCKIPKPNLDKKKTSCFDYLLDD